MKDTRKIAVIGAGRVGAATAYTLALSALAGEIVLVDIDEKRARGEALDIAHGLPLYAALDVKSEVRAFLTEGKPEKKEAQPCRTAV